MRSTFVVSLRGLRFHTLVGVLPHEREVPQPLEIDVSVWVTPTAAPPDRTAPLVVDYRVVYELTARAASAPINYLEDLVSEIAARMLELPGAGRTRVSARKPHAALGGPLDGAEVAIEAEADTNGHAAA